MMTLTRTAGMDIVVEGVDEEGQKQYLTDLGFQKLQGKLFEYLLPEKKTVK
jgi:EAL domain-containing protein (putative c-di-GMP-specific phosphodiesterase class I)